MKNKKYGLKGLLAGVLLFLGTTFSATAQETLPEKIQKLEDLAKSKGTYQNFFGKESVLGRSCYVLESQGEIGIEGFTYNRGKLYFFPNTVVLEAISLTSEMYFFDIGKNGLDMGDSIETNERITRARKIVFIKKEDTIITNYFNNTWNRSGMNTFEYKDESERIKNLNLAYSYLLNGFN